MKRLLTLLLGMTTTAIFGQTPTGNILANPAFEQWSGQMPLSWSIAATVASKGTVQSTTVNARSGLALVLRPNSTNTDDLFALNLAQGFAINSYLGKTLDIHGAIGAEGGSTAYVSAWVISGSGEILAFGGLRNASTAAYMDGQIAIPNDVRAMLLIVAVQVWGQTGAAYFDDLSVAVGQPQGNEAGPLSATAHIDAASAIRTIPRTLYGMNITWPYGGTLLWDFRSGGFNQTILDLTANLQPPLLRFPGGTFADYYHWRDGVGPVSSRPNTRPTPTDDYSPHLLGTDEALTVAERTGSNLLITVNTNTGTATEAADWVHYVNGQSVQRRVKFWEVGNEAYINSGSGFTIPPSEYARRLASYSAAMKTADKRIKVIGIGAENFGRYQNNSYPGWNETVLRNAGSSMDYLALHNAYFPALVMDNSVYDVRTVYRAMLAAPLLIKANLDTVSGQIDRFGGGKDIRIAVTEWGPLFHVSPQSPWVDHVKTMGSALYTASTLKVFLESPKVDIANAFRLNDVGFMGWIGAVDPNILTQSPAYGEFRPTASFQVLQLFAKNFGDVLVSSQVDSPSYTSSPVGMAEGVANVPYLEVVSSLSADRSVLKIAVINKHFDSAIDTQLNFVHFTPDGSGTARELSATGIDANTGTQLPAVATWARQMEDVLNPRFYQGAPEEVSLKTISLTGITSTLQRTFPARSVTFLEIYGSVVTP